MRLIRFLGEKLEEHNRAHLTSLFFSRPLTYELRIDAFPASERIIWDVFYARRHGKAFSPQADGGSYVVPTVS